MKVKDLTPNAKNPRTITDKKKSMLKKALLEFGDLSGIVFNRKTKQLVGGHQRRDVFDSDSVITYTKKYSKPTKTGTVAEGFVELKGERFSYREVFWPEHKEKAANIAANKGAGEWNMPQLTEWIKELNDFDLEFDLELTMFDEDELKQFDGTTVKEHTRKGPTGVDEDEVPEVAPPRTKLGDIYQLGDHRLMCGDSTDEKQVTKLFDGATCDITFTSPPYNAGKNIRGNFYAHDADNKTEDDYLGFLVDFTSIAFKFSKFVFVNLQLLESNKRAVVQYQVDFLQHLKDILIWNKTQYPPHINKGTFGTKWEYLLCFGETGKSRGFPCKWQGKFPNVIETENNSANEYAGIHRAGFPVSFPFWIIEKMDFAKSCYDPFMGTGTTFIACEKAGIKGYGMEIDPQYCDVIVDRWEKYTGNKAKLLNPRPETKLKKTSKQSINSHA